MSRLLQKFGHDVRGARSMAEARNVADEGAFDLLLCDIGLPDGSGLELIRELRTRGAGNGHPPFKGIALTGYGITPEESCAHDQGFDAHLTKPIDLDNLRRTIDELASNNGGASSL